MPIFRYFVFVGGALLALLLAVDFVLPSQPVAQAVATTVSNDQPLIRIRSNRHLPERVVLDTTQPTIGPPAVTVAAVVAPQPPVQDSTAALAEMSAKARVRETFAQFTPAGPKAGAAVAATKADAKPQVQANAQPAQAPQAQPPKRRTARVYSAPQQQDRPMMVAQRPQFGFFGNTW
jgi:hypothetical protein